LIFVEKRIRRLYIRALLCLSQILKENNNRDNAATPGYQCLVVVSVALGAAWTGIMVEETGRDGGLKETVITDVMLGGLELGGLRLGGLELGGLELEVITLGD
jgi:hypothetical protein